MRTTINDEFDCLRNQNLQRRLRVYGVSTKYHEYHVNVANLVTVAETIEIINNNREGIQDKIWERANGGQIQVPDVLDNENCTVHPNIELSVPNFQSIRDLNLPIPMPPLVLFIISMDH